MTKRQERERRPREGKHYPWGFLEIDARTFDKYYEHLIEHEDLDRLPRWDDKQATITWVDVAGGHPALMMKEYNGAVYRYVKQGYYKHRFEPVFGSIRT